MSNPRSTCPDCGHEQQDDLCWNPDCETGDRNIAAVWADIELRAQRDADAEWHFDERRET